MRKNENRLKLDQLSNFFNEIPESLSSSDDSEFLSIFKNFCRFGPLVVDHVNHAFVSFQYKQYPLFIHLFLFMCLNYHYIHKCSINCDYYLGKFRLGNIVNLVVRSVSSNLMRWLNSVSILKNIFSGILYLVVKLRGLVSYHNRIAKYLFHL